VSDAAFDDCGKKGMKDLAAAAQGGTLMGSFAHGHASPPSTTGAIRDVVTAHFNGEMDASEAVDELVSAVESAR